MAYDFHGGWDDVTGPHSALHSKDGLNTEHALDLYLAAGVPSSKIVCGLPLYGRAWTLQKTGRIEYGVKASGLAKPGVCTQEAGVLNQMEIKNLIGKNFKVDKDTQTVIGWSGDQFVTFDNEETLGYKIDYFCQRGLGGVMTWAMSMDDDYKLMSFIHNKVASCSTPTPPTPSSSSSSSGVCGDTVQCTKTMLECIKHTQPGQECACSETWSKCLSDEGCKP